MIRSLRPAYSLAILLPFISALVACAPLIPATVPPHIKNTPGAFVVVTDKLFATGDFRLEFPRAWSVVKTSQAYYGHIQVNFLAPDGGTVFIQQVDAIDSSSGEHKILSNGVILKVSVEAAEGSSAAFAQQARQLISSIRS